MGAAQVLTNVRMPPKDGTPCHAGACRGGFGRADPGQPRCDRPLEVPHTAKTSLATVHRMVTPRRICRRWPVTKSY
jgi:hypothetical protein